MIDFTKPVTTRDGRAVVIFGTDFAEPYPVRGYIEGAVPKLIESWTGDGVYSPRRGSDPQDLINPKARIKRQLYLNVYPVGVPVAHSSRGMADFSGRSCGGGDQRFACIPISIDCEEGEGL